MKREKLQDIVNKGMIKLVGMGMPSDYDIDIEQSKDSPNRHMVAIVIEPNKLDWSYLAFALDKDTNIIDNVYGNLKKELENLAEPSIYVLGDIGNTLGCEWMQTISEKVAKYGPWAKNEDGIYRINLDLFTSF